MAPPGLTLLAPALLLGLLLIARRLERARARGAAVLLNQALSPGAERMLDIFALGVDEQDLGLMVVRKAVAGRDAALLQRAVGYVEAFAPGVREGLLSIRHLSRAVSVIVELPPVPALAWRAWQLRSASAMARVLHHALVSGAERVRLRAWLLGRALAFSLGALRRAARRPSPAWAGVEAAVADLDTVGTESKLTYERVIRCLDALSTWAARAAMAAAGGR